MQINQRFLNTGDTWEIMIFIGSILLPAILLVGFIYIIEKLIFNEDKENSYIYIFKSILYIGFLFILYGIFGYTQLCLSILLAILIFLLIFYFMPTLFDKIKYWHIGKKAKMKLDILAVKKTNRNWSNIKNEIIKQFLAYNGIVFKSSKPKLRILDIQNTNAKYREKLATAYRLITVEVWVKKETSHEEYNEILSSIISENTDLLTLEEYKKLSSTWNTNNIK